MENISATAVSAAEGSSTTSGQVNSWEVSSTSEDTTNQPTSSTNKSNFVNLYEEDVLGCRSDNISGTSASGDTGEYKKPNPGLQLLKEYADSGNDTEEEAVNLRKAAEEKAKELAKALSNKNEISNVEHVVGVSSEVADDGSKSLTESVNTGVADSGNEIPNAEDKVPSPISKKGEDNKDLDSDYTVPGDKNLPRLERSVSKEEGQISADSDSDESEISSLSGKGSKNQMKGKKDKSRKNKKKKKKKKHKQKHSLEKKESQSGKQCSLQCKIKFFIMSLVKNYANEVQQKLILT